MDYKEKYDLQVKVNADLHELINKLTNENEKLKAQLEKANKKVVETNSYKSGTSKGVVEFG